MTWAWRPLTDGELDHETLWAAVALALGVLLALWIRFVEWPPVLCPFRAITSLPCPTCGATRAVFALLRGDLLGALRLNPLVAGALLLAVPYLAYALVVSVCRLPRLRVTVDGRTAWWARRVVVTGVAVCWAFLIADGR